MSLHPVKGPSPDDLVSPFAPGRDRTAVLGDDGRLASVDTRRRHTRLWPAPAGDVAGRAAGVAAQVRKVLEERFAELIDLTDQHWPTEKHREDARLSRSLAALATQIEHPCGDVIAARAVFDGQDNRGLDAIAIELRTTQPRISLVRAKWNHQGKGRFGEDEVHKMLRGLDLILHLDVLQLLQDGVDRRPGHGHSQLQRSSIYVTSTPRSSATPRRRRSTPGCVLRGLGHESMPYQAMYGTRSVPDVAALFTEYPSPGLGSSSRSGAHATRSEMNHLILVLDGQPG